MHGNAKNWHGRQRLHLLSTDKAWQGKVRLQPSRPDWSGHCIEQHTHDSPRHSSAQRRLRRQRFETHRYPKHSSGYAWQVPQRTATA